MKEEIEGKQSNQNIDDDETNVKVNRSPATCKVSLETGLRRGESVASEPPQTSVPPTTTTYRQRSSPFPSAMSGKSRDREGVVVPRATRTPHFADVHMTSGPSVMPSVSTITSSSTGVGGILYPTLQSLPTSELSPQPPESYPHNHRTSTSTLNSFVPVPPPPLRRPPRNITEENPGAMAVYPNDPIRNAGLRMPGDSDDDDPNSLTLMRGESSSAATAGGTLIFNGNTATTQPVIMAHLVRQSEEFHNLELLRAQLGANQTYIGEAVEVKEYELNRRRTICSLMKDWRVIGLVILLIAALVGLTIGLLQLARRQDEMDDVPEVDNRTIFLEPYQIAENELIVENQLIPLLPQGSVNAIATAGTSHHGAIDWLVNNIVLKGLPVFRIIQKYVLAVLFYSTGGPSSWREHPNWLSTKSECEWGQSSSYKGMTVRPCMENETLQSLVLADNLLVGFVPADVALLSSLVTLAFPSNLLQGSTPQTGPMTNLQTLDLSSNILQGELPALQNQNRLLHLDLSGNSFQGGIPDTYEELEDLQVLNLSDNPGINGTIPTAMSQLSNLRVLNLEGTDLTGTVPDAICQISMQDNVTVDCERVACDCCTC